MYTTLMVRLTSALANWYADEAAATGGTPEQLAAIVLAEHQEWLDAARTALRPASSPSRTKENPP